MHQLNACQSDRGVPEAFEAEHDVRSGLDVAMILLDEIIQILRGSDLRILGQQAVRLHLAHGAVRGCIAVERNRFRRLALMFDCLSENALAAATSRLALSRKSTVCPARSTAR